MNARDTPGPDRTAPVLPPEAEAWLQAHPEVAPAGLEEAWRLAAYAEAFEPVAAPDAARFAAMRAEVGRVVRQPERRPEQRTDHRADRPPQRLRRVRVAWAVAAAVVLVAAGVAFWLRPVVLQAPFGERLTAVLPDGSRVELNSGSSLRYRRTFGWRARRVDLHGEAFFDVVAADVPFSVRTFNSAVTVLGTRFSVRAWPDDELPETAVVLEAGVVRFAARQAAAAPVVLQPGQMSRVPAGAAAPTAPVPVAVEERLTWRSGGLVFVDQPIGTILNELERRFGIRIETHPAAIRNVRLSLIADRVGGAEDVLAMIAGTRGYTYRAVEGGYVLDAP